MWSVLRTARHTQSPSAAKCGWDGRAAAASLGCRLMKAVQIVELSGPRDALSVVDVPEPEATPSRDPGARRAGRGPRRRRVVSRGAADPRPVPGQARGPVHPRQRGRRHRALRAGRRRRPSRRPGGRLLHAGRLGRGRGGARVLRLQAARRARLRPGRRPGAQLPHRLLRAEAARSAGRGRDRARARRRRRRRHRLAAGRARPRRDARSRSSPPTRRSGWPARPAPTRSCAATAPGRTRPRSSRGAESTSSSTRSAATASPTACARCARAGG